MESELQAKFNYHLGLFRKVNFKKGQLVSFDDFRIIQTLRSLDNLITLKFGIDKKYILNKFIVENYQKKKGYWSSKLKKNFSILNK